MDQSSLKPLAITGPKKVAHYYPGKWCSLGVETAVQGGDYKGGSPLPSPLPPFGEADKQKKKG
jgi:hypothetical protein